MMPNLLRTINRFEETMEFRIIKKTIVDHRIVETPKVKVQTYFEGTRQPIPPSKLLVKSEGERKFKWWLLYTDIELERDWQIVDIHEVVYTIMSVTDWSQGGYFAYELIEGPTS